MKEKFKNFKEGEEKPTTLSSHTQRKPTTFNALVQRHTLPVFFILVFLLTWPLQVLDALGSHGLLPFRVPILYQILFVSYMPTVAAIVVTSIKEGKVGVKALLQKVLIWRVGIGWYIFAIFGFAVFCCGAVILTNLVSTEEFIPLLGRDLANSSGVQIIFMVFVLFIAVTLVNGEELAWRGFALPRLQEKYSALTSSLLLGLVWVLFHIPLLLTNTGFPLNVLGMVSTSVQLIGASVIFTWLYNHTQGSVLLAYLFHGSVNTWTRVFPINESPALTGWLLTAFICLFALFLVLVYGPKHLVRKGQQVEKSAPDE